MFLRQQVIWCPSVSQDNELISKTCNNFLTVYLDPQTIANPKVWNNTKIHWSMVASDLVQGISHCFRCQLVFSNNIYMDSDFLSKVNINHSTQGIKYVIINRQGNNKPTRLFYVFHIYLLYLD